MAIRAPRLDGCDLCVIDSFTCETDRWFHFNNCSAHRTRSLIHLSALGVPRVLIAEVTRESITSILSEFEHLPLLGMHYCTKCGLNITVSSRESIESVASELNGHLRSKEHRHRKTSTLTKKIILEDIGSLPSKTIIVDHDKYTCYRCESFPDFSSFPSLCLHVHTIHKSKRLEPIMVTSTEPEPEPWPELEYITVNEDGISRTCTLCNVVVWSVDDPHLNGKRHAKALWYYNNGDGDSRFTSEV
jgi:hypothetical protein